MPEEAKKNNESDILIAGLILGVLLLGGLATQFGTIKENTSMVLDPYLRGRDAYEVPPQTTEEEQAMIGGLIDGSLLPGEVRPFVAPWELIDGRHGLILDTILIMDSAGEAISFNSVRERLRARGRLAEAGGRGYLEELVRASAEAKRGSVLGIALRIFDWFNNLLFWIIVFSILGTAYSVFRLVQIQNKVIADYLKIIPQFEDTHAKEEMRWQRVVTLAASENPSDRKVAIIEADAILGELLTLMQYEGDSIANQLKQVERSDFHTLQDAWKAHKLRNRIVHDGVDVSPDDARYIIALYENVFREFEYI